MDQKQSLSLVIGANDTLRTDRENGAKQLAHVFRQLGDETTLLAGNGTRSILTDFFNSSPKNTMTFLSLVVIGTTMVDQNGALHARLSSEVDCIDDKHTIALHELFSMANEFTTTHQASLFVWLDISGVVPTNETVYKFFNDAIDWNHKNIATLVPIEPYRSRQRRHAVAKDILFGCIIVSVATNDRTLHCGASLWVARCREISKRRVYKFFLLCLHTSLIEGG